MHEQIIENYLSDALETFRSYKKLAEKATAQISDEEFFRAIDAEANSIAALTKHLGGNLRSRWTDFLTADGEKPDRDRDSEFVAEGDTRESLTAFWEAGWRALFGALEALTPADCGRTVKIRGEDYTVVKAINRALAHTAMHVGQIILLAKHFRGSDWETLSIPKNKSGDFNAFLAENKDQAHYLEAAEKFKEKG
jgi:hypothetical protein